MPKLTDKAIRALKPRESAYKEFDGQGLYISVQPNGSRLWRLKYRFGGKERLAALGAYPVVTLAAARVERDKLRRLLANGIDPSAHQKAARLAQRVATENTLEFVATEWFDTQSAGWVPKYSSKIIQRLKRDIFPWAGSRPISEMTAPEVIAILRRIEDRGAVETAHRALRDLSKIFQYAVVMGHVTSNPCRDLRGALSPRRVRHFAAITDPKEIPALLKAMYGYEGGMVVRSALRLAPLLFVRPGELRSARWIDIDFEAAQWRFTASKTKQPHIVPLATQAIAVLRELHPLTGGSEFVFPSQRSSRRPMSENAVNAALRSLGIEREKMCGHGFRAMARTVLDEHLKFPAYLIEAQLAHVVRDPNGTAYNRAAHLEERCVMMQKWADYLLLNERTT